MRKSFQCADQYADDFLPALVDDSFTRHRRLMSMGDGPVSTYRVVNAGFKGDMREERVFDTVDSRFSHFACLVLKEEKRGVPRDLRDGTVARLTLDGQQVLAICEEESSVIKRGDPSSPKKLRLRVDHSLLRRPVETLIGSIAELDCAAAGVPLGLCIQPLAFMRRMEFQDVRHLLRQPPPTPAPQSATIAAIRESTGLDHMQATALAAAREGRAEVLIIEGFVT